MKAPCCRARAKSAAESRICPRAGFASEPDGDAVVDAKPRVAPTSDNKRDDEEEDGDDGGD